MPARARPATPREGRFRPGLTPAHPPTHPRRNPAQRAPGTACIRRFSTLTPSNCRDLLLILQQRTPTTTTFSFTRYRYIYRPPYVRIMALVILIRTAVWWLRWWCGGGGERRWQNISSTQHMLCWGRKAELLPRVMICLSPCPPCPLHIFVHTCSKICLKKKQVGTRK